MKAPLAMAILSLALITILVTLGIVVGCGGGSDTDLVAAPPALPVVAVPVDSTPLEKKAAALAGKLGKPGRLLVGLGTTNVDSIRIQGLKPDIYDRYINGVGTDSWRTWNLPEGAYIGVVAKNADNMGAVPMFTLYQMAALGDSNITGLADSSFMKGYWDNVRLLFQQLKTYNKPALVNFEPDFWGYAHRVSADPNKHYVHVNNINPDCANLPNSVAGMGACLLQMARSGAPNAFVGFPPSQFPDIATNEMSYLRQVGAAQADFVVMQTLDRDAGCFEAKYTGENALCVRPSALPYYWDASNTSTPSFASHFAYARSYHQGLQLPVLWWQTPMGVPSDTPGGTAYAFRDNRVSYFLTRPQELVAAGGVGVVFSPGQNIQTNIDTDGGQFKRLTTQYFSAPAALP